MACISLQPHVWWCDMLKSDTFTVFNQWLNPSTKAQEYKRTVITGCHWREETKGAITQAGMTRANVLTIRIPTSADTQGKTFKNEKDFASDPTNAYTFKLGDILVKGNIVQPSTITDLQKNFDHCYTCKGYSDNRIGIQPHIKVVG